MSAIRRQESGGLRTFREAYPRGYGPREHVDWLLEVPGFRIALAGLRRDGMEDRKASLAWREYDVDEVENFGADRAERYASKARKIESVLPPSLAGLIRLLLVGDRLPKYEISDGYRLQDEGRVCRLQALCERRLDPKGRALSSAEGGALRRIDPGRPIQVSIELRSHLLEEDQISVSATGGAVGSWVGGASQAGFPGIGRLVRAEEYEGALHATLELASISRKERQNDDANRTAR